MNNSREKIIIRTSVINILINIALASLKAVVGMLSNSIAIVSDAINNISDALSSIITIIGTKLAGKAPDRNHPYGYGRVEYMASFFVSVIVLYVGISLIIESIKKIINPDIPDYSNLTLIVLISSVVIKLILGLLVKKKGKEVNSDSLVASGYDALVDVIISISVLLSAVLYISFNISVEAYVGIFISLFIIKTGVDLIIKSTNNMIGVRVESDLSRNIKKEIVKEKDVQGAYDLILNNYGPDKYLGSVHIEVPDTLTVSEVDKISRRITKNIMKKYGVMLHTIGAYSINTKDRKIMNIHENIKKIVFSHEGVLQMHGFYLDEEDNTISFDIIIDFNVKNKEEIYRKIYDEVKKEYKDYKISITLDIDISD